MNYTVVMSAVIVSLVGGCSVATMKGCGSGYSHGSRVGTVRKLSEKGLIWKSWEGELVLGGSVKSENGPIIEVWSFSATPAAASNINQIMLNGKKCELTYDQWFIGPISQNSTYTVTGVKTTE